MKRASQLLESAGQPMVCELTAGGRGAICVLGVSGGEVVDAASRFFHAANARPLASQPLRKPVYGRWNDEDLIVCVHSDSYLEVHCHGGEFAKQRIVSDLGSLGFASQPWTGIEVEPARTCLAAWLELPKTTTRKTAAILNWQANAALATALQEIDSWIHAGRDQRAAQAIRQLLRRAPLGLHLTDPWNVAIAGPPNAGKSSLINRLVGYDRSIVFDTPGTTRDLVAVETAINGWPVRLVDTAGLRSSRDSIERAGITLAGQAIADADLVIEVVDLSAASPEAAPAAAAEASPEIPIRQLQRVPSDRKLTVLNKCDLADPPDARAGLPVSAVTGQGVEELLAAVSTVLVPEEPEPGAAVPFLPSQIDELTARLQRLNVPR